MSTFIQFKCEVCHNIQKEDSKCQCCGSEALIKEECTSNEECVRVSDTPQVVIIGGGIASLSVIRSLVEKGIRSITLISKENHFPYYRTTIPKILHDPSFCENYQFLIEQQKYYETNKINLLIGFTVKSIDMENKIVVAEKDGVVQEKYFTDLVLAIGGEPNKPPFIQNCVCDGVIPIHSVADMKRINERFEKKTIKDVVIIGAGLSGIEIASSLRRRSKEISVTMVEVANRILPRQLSEPASAIFSNVITSNGIQLKLNSVVKEIHSEGDRIEVVLDKEEKILCDLVCYSCGIKSSTGLASMIGCKTNRGIIVDSFMRTSIPNVYACGDCCEYEGQCYGNWTDAMKQGTTCGNVIAGKTDGYIHTTMPYFVYCFIGVYSVGSIQGESVIKQNGNDFMQIFLNEKTIVGGNLIGKAITKIQRELVNAIQTKVSGEDAEKLIEQWKTYF